MRIASLPLRRRSAGTRGGRSESKSRRHLMRTRWFKALITSIASLLASTAFGRLPRAADHADRAVGRGRRHRCRRRASSATLMEKDLGQPVNVVNRTGGSRRGRPPGDRGGRARRLHHRHDHGRDRDDAPPGPHRAQGRDVHADRPGQRRPGGRAGARRLAVQERQRTARRDQGQPRQVQGLGHRPGRHLAPGDRRPAAATRRSTRPRCRGCRPTAPRPACRTWWPAASRSCRARCPRRAR